MPPSPLEIIRLLASQVKRVNPSAMSKGDVAQWRGFSRDKYLPMQRKLWEQQAKMEERAANTWNEARQAEHLASAEELGYTADRFGKMAAASDTIARAAPMKLMGGDSMDPNLRGSFLPGPDGAPGGVIAYQLPQHLPDDPLLDASTLVELLGADPRVKGAGRVLLRDAGMTSPSNPLSLHSVPDPKTMDFYTSRGMELIPRQVQERSPGLHSTLPAYRIDRGDLLKEAKGGVVKMADGGFLDFTKDPTGASRRLHTTSEDVAVGERMDRAYKARNPATYDSGSSTEIGIAPQQSDAKWTLEEYKALEDWQRRKKQSGWARAKEFMSDEVAPTMAGGLAALAKNLWPVDMANMVLPEDKKHPGSAGYWLDKWDPEILKTPQAQDAELGVNTAVSMAMAPMLGKLALKAAKPLAGAVVGATSDDAQAAGLPDILRRVLTASGKIVDYGGSHKGKTVGQLHETPFADRRWISPNLVNTETERSLARQAEARGLKLDTVGDEVSPSGFRTLHKAQGGPVNLQSWHDVFRDPEYDEWHKLFKEAA